MEGSLDRCVKLEKPQKYLWPHFKSLWQLRDKSSKEREGVQQLYNESYKNKGKTDEEVSKTFHYIMRGDDGNDAFQNDRVALIAWRKRAKYSHVGLFVLEQIRWRIKPWRAAKSKQVGVFVREEYTCFTFLKKEISEFGWVSRDPHPSFFTQWSLCFRRELPNCFVSLTLFANLLKAVLDDDPSTWRVCQDAD